MIYLSNVINDKSERRKRRERTHTEARETGGPSDCIPCNYVIIHIKEKRINSVIFSVFPLLVARLYIQPVSLILFFFICTLQRKKKKQSGWMEEEAGRLLTNVKGRASLDSTQLRLRLIVSNHFFSSLLFLVVLPAKKKKKKWKMLTFLSTFVCPTLSVCVCPGNINIIIRE